MVQFKVIFYHICMVEMVKNFSHFQHCTCFMNLKILGSHGSYHGFYNSNKSVGCATGPRMQFEGNAVERHCSTEK